MGLRHFLKRQFKRHPDLKFAEYGHALQEFTLPTDGTIEYAQWLHPLESPKSITQQGVDALREYIKPGDFVIDIGAHAGDTTVPMALAAGPTGCTLGLEPNRYVFKILQENGKLNRGKVNIDLQCWAATEEEGEFVFHYGDASFVNGGFKPKRQWFLYRREYPLKVQGRCLEHVLRSQYAEWLPKLSYLKVDAEGSDVKILTSIRSILQQYQPVIRTEVFFRLSAKQRHTLYDLFAGLEYEVFRYEESGTLQGRKMERGDMTRTKHFDVLAVPRRVLSRKKVPSTDLEEG